MTVRVNRERTLKARVAAHWAAEPCGTRQAPASDRAAYFVDIERHRHLVEPHIIDFADFRRSKGQRVLEVGTGAGTDYVQWLRAGCKAVGVDLTREAVALAAERARIERYSPRLLQADAEHLPFATESFDVVYSYGVLHHTPATQQAVSEVYRVLRIGGEARIMIYHRPSITGLLLWLVHGLGRLQPWRSPSDIMFEHLESPGTKAYTRQQASELFSAFTSVQVWSKLSPGDMLLMRPSAKYSSVIWKWAILLFPRGLVRLVGDRVGLFLFVVARK